MNKYEYKGNLNKGRNSKVAKAAFADMMSDDCTIAQFEWNGVSVKRHTILNEKMLGIEFGNANDINLKIKWIMDSKMYLSGLPSPDSVYDDVNKLDQFDRRTLILRMLRDNDMGGDMFDALVTILDEYRYDRGKLKETLESVVDYYDLGHIRK